LDGQTLTVEATNLAGRGALGGKTRDIPVPEITALDLSTATAMTNGTLTVVSPTGKTLVHYRRKQAAGVAAIYDALTAAAAGAATGAAAKQQAKSSSLQRGEGHSAQEAAAELESTRAAALELIDAVRTFEGFSALEAQQHGFILGRGERLYGVVEDAQLVEIKHAKGHYRYGGTSMRFRVAKGVSLGAGGGRGSYVPGPEAPTSIDQGLAAITSTRVIFRGPRQSREWAFAKLTGLDHAADGSWSALSVSNRQTTSGLGYPSGAARMVRFQMTLALAEFQGTREDLAASLEAELNDLR
jgi:biotin operon repressor